MTRSFPFELYTQLQDVVRSHQSSHKSTHSSLITCVLQPLDALIHHNFYLFLSIFRSMHLQFPSIRRSGNCCTLEKYGSFILRKRTSILQKQYTPRGFKCTNLKKCDFNLINFIREENENYDVVTVFAGIPSEGL